MEGIVPVFIVAIEQLKQAIPVKCYSTKNTLIAV